MANMDDVLGSLAEQEQNKQEEQKRLELVGAVKDSGNQVTNALQSNLGQLNQSIHELLLGSLVTKDPKIVEVAKQLSGLLKTIDKTTTNIKGANFKPLSDNLAQLQQTLETIPKQIEEAHATNNPIPHLQEIASTLGAKDFSPTIKVGSPSVDLSSLNKLLTDIKTELGREIPTTDTSKLEKLISSVAAAVKGVETAVTSLRFPVPNYVLPFQTNVGKATQVKLDSSGNVPIAGTVTATIDTTGLATSAKQSDGSQKTQLVDGSGNVVGSTSNALDVNVKSGAVTANAGTGTFVVAGNKTNNNAVPGATNIGALVGVANAVAPTYTEGDQILLSTDLTGTLRVNATVSGGSGTSAGDNSAFTANSTSGTPAMGFYHSTIDTVTDGHTATVGLTSKRAMFTNLQNAAGAETGVAATPLQVSLANTGANVNKLLVTPDALPANQSVNISQINGVAPLMGNGITGTGSQRVTIASDNTAFAVNATLSAETTKAIGVVRTSDGSGNLLTSTANALDINVKSGSLAVQSTPAIVDEAVFVDATSTFMPIGGVYTDTTGILTNNKQGIARQTAWRAIHTNLRDSSGYELGSYSRPLVVNDNLQLIDGNPIVTSVPGVQQVTIAGEFGDPLSTTGNALNVAVMKGGFPTGATTYFNSALTNTPIQIRVGSSAVTGFEFQNPNSTNAYVQIFDTIRGGVTLGTTVPLFSFLVPGNGAQDKPLMNLPYINGLVIAATTTATGSTAPTSALVVNLW